MKRINLESNFQTLKNLLFCSQLIIASFGLPALYVVGISHKQETVKTDKVLLTNKGKRILYVLPSNTIADNPVYLASKKNK